MSWRYYSTQRPVAPGTFPKPQGNMVVDVQNFDSKRLVDSIGCKAWGYVDYEHILDMHEAEQYELIAPRDFTFKLTFSKDEPYTLTIPKAFYTDAWKEAVNYAERAHITEPDEDDNFLMCIEWMSTEQRHF